MHTLFNKVRKATNLYLNTNYWSNLRMDNEWPCYIANVFSHWPSPYPEWSLQLPIIRRGMMIMMKMQLHSYDTARGQYLIRRSPVSYFIRSYLLKRTWRRSFIFPVNMSFDWLHLNIIYWIYKYLPVFYGGVYEDMTIMILIFSAK